MLYIFSIVGVELGILFVNAIKSVLSEFRFINWSERDLMNAVSQDLIRDMQGVEYGRI